MERYSSLKCTIIFASFCLYTASSVDNNCAEIWGDNLDKMSKSSATIRLTLLHREHPCSPASTRQADSSSTSTLSRYHARVRRLASSFSSCPAPEANVSGPILANAVPWDYFSYVTRIRLGTPARTHFVLVDTGSSLSWIGCEPYSGCMELDPIFDPAASSTYNIIRCRSSICNAVPAATMSRSTCLAPFQKCSYKQKYADNATCQGVVSSDRLIYGREDMEGFVFGCCNYLNGLVGKYSGIIGLSTNRLSFFSQLTIGRRYRAMSYCLPHPHNQGFLQFGQYNEQQSELSFTSLFIDGDNYYVHIASITVGRASLDVRSAEPEDQTMRCFFDTGTPFTMLPTHLFSTLSNVVGNRIRGFFRVSASEGRTCFKRDDYWNQEDVYIPTVRIVFQDGSRITLVAGDLLFREKGPEQVYCLAFRRNDRGDVVLGSKHLMGLHTVVDLEKSTMGLRDGGCN